MKIYWLFLQLLQKINMQFLIRRLFLAIFSLVIFSSLTLHAQDTIKSPPKLKKHRDILSRMDFGGYLGAQFGSVTIIEVSPQASYRVTESFHAGLGFTYNYYKDTYYTPDYSASSYGCNIFGRYFIWQDLFAHVEYAPLYVNYYEYYDNGSGGYYRVKGASWAHDFLIGGGYRQMIGDRASMNLMLLWNVNESYFSPYRNPIIRIGFGVGL
jgi:hypothetical protein